MKIVFLDFDGVLNSHWYMLEFPKEWNSGMAVEGQIDPESVALVNKIVEDTGAVVVISSAWRLVRSLDDLTRMLANKGFKGEVIGITPDLAHLDKRRGDEIQEWLDTSPLKDQIESFVILDDNSDMVHLTDKLVLTGYTVGIEEHHVEKAIEILNAVNG